MSLHCKVRLLKYLNEEEEVRRFKVDENVATNFEYLKSKIVSTFPTLKDGEFNVYWKDEEGDFIEFSSDEELIDALAQTREASNLFHVTIKKTKKQPSSSSTSPQFTPGYDFSQNPPRHESWQDPRRQYGFGAWRAPGFMQHQGGYDSMYWPSHEGSYRFPGPQSFHGSPRHAFSAGDPRFGCWGVRGPSESQMRSWSTSAENGNVQMQQQSQMQSHSGSTGKEAKDESYCS